MYSYLAKNILNANRRSPLVPYELMEKSLFTQKVSRFRSSVNAALACQNWQQKQNTQPIFSALESQLEVKPNFQKISFVCGQHLLATIMPLFNFFIRFHAIPSNIFVTGKSYSNHQETIEKLLSLGIKIQPTRDQTTLGGFTTAYISDIVKMWENFYRTNTNPDKHKSEGIIVLDDGGLVLDNIPCEIFARSAPSKTTVPLIGIEQTTSGVHFSEALPCPTIELATCAVKKWFEPQWIATKAAHELKKNLENTFLKHPEFIIKKPVIGIIGLGGVGFETLKALYQQGYQDFLLCDIDSSKLKEAQRYGKKNKLNIIDAKRVYQVLHGADIIIGCTGVDIMSDVMHEFRTIRSPKFIASLSSRDSEVKSFLNHIQKNNRNDGYRNPLENIIYKNGFGAPIVILKGGFPINFTNGAESVPANKIQLIRGLEAVAALQATEMLKEKNIPAANYQLDAQKQAIVLEQFLKVEPTEQEVYSSVFNKKWGEVSPEELINMITQESGGEVYRKQQKQSSLNHLKNCYIS